MWFITLPIRRWSPTSSTSPASSATFSPVIWIVIGLTFCLVLRVSEAARGNQRYFLEFRQRKVRQLLEHMFNELVTKESSKTPQEVSDELYEPWTTWTRCSDSCTQKRFRRCRRGVECDEVKIREKRSCWKPRMSQCSGYGNTRRRVGAEDAEAMGFILIELLYYDWSEWSPCTRSCSRRRYRTCEYKPICKNMVLLEQEPCSAEGSNCEAIFDKYKGKEVDVVEEGRTDGGLLFEESSDTGESDRKDRKKEKERERVSESRESSAADIDWKPGRCGIRNVTGTLRIVGGVQARRGAWPWQVAILSKRYKEQYCGGVLISPQHVLTAAHCVRKGKRRGRRRRVIVRVGEYDLSLKDATERDMRTVVEYVHSDFDIDTIDSDIAVLKLQTPVEIGTNVDYACVPDSEDILPVRTMCYAVGWGKMDDKDFFGAPIIREARVPLISGERCQSAFDYEITKNQLCAGYPHGGVDTCAGDSGGPLMCEIERNGRKRWHVYGVTSFGEGCGERGKYGVYTQVYKFSEWISDILQKDLSNNSSRRHS